MVFISAAPFFFQVFYRAMRYAHHGDVYPSNRKFTSDPIVETALCYQCLTFWSFFNLTDFLNSSTKTVAWKF
ncbi:hypothetical protein Y032_0031g2301 [Ancylostoma ceylanicum]|uniref:Uncharacterized protein n=1 Tax=Ancylostoma ceylanicum TaxID=53326 RepID=A0A016UP36_9BILA|nr:hypothetical protein Y032_0031g2301 [Ancylostoma ceylanicum]